MTSKRQTLSTARLISSDLRAMIPELARGRTRDAAAALLKILLYPRIRVVIYYRLSHAAIRWRLAPLAFYFQQMGLRCGGAEIHPLARIGSSFCLFHSSGVVIGDRVVIGNNFRCFHGVTLGNNGDRIGQPVVADHVTIYAGAKVVGPISIGDRAVIGANAVVFSDVPADRIAVGIPARLLDPPAT